MLQAVRVYKIADYNVPTYARDPAHSLIELPWCFKHFIAFKPAVSMVVADRRSNAGLDSGLQSANSSKVNATRANATGANLLRGELH